jgi:hypothetical protein
MRPRNEAKQQKETTQTKDKRKLKTTSRPRKEPSQNRKQREARKKDPKKQPKEELKQQQPNSRHTTNWVPVPLFEQRPMTGLASSARRADSTFDVAEWADRRVLSLVAFEDRWRDLIGACKSPTQFCPPSIRDRKPLPKERH